MSNAGARASSGAFKLEKRSRAAAAAGRTETASFSRASISADRGRIRISRAGSFTSPRSTDFEPELDGNFWASRGPPGSFGRPCRIQACTSSMFFLFRSSRLVVSFCIRARNLLSNLKGDIRTTSFHTPYRISR